MRKQEGDVEKKVKKVGGGEYWTTLSQVVETEKVVARGKVMRDFVT